MADITPELARAIALATLSLLAFVAAFIRW